MNEENILLVLKHVKFHKYKKNKADFFVIFVESPLSAFKNCAILRVFESGETFLTLQKSVMTNS